MTSVLLATYPMPVASIMLTGILKVSYIVGCFQIGLLLCGIVARGFTGSHIQYCAWALLQAFVLTSCLHFCSVLHLAMILTDAQCNVSSR